MFLNIQSLVSSGMALLYHREAKQGMQSDPIEPGHIADVLLVERNRLRLRYDHAGQKGMPSSP